MDGKSQQNIGNIAMLNLLISLPVRVEAGHNVVVSLPRGVAGGCTRSAGGLNSQDSHP